MHYLALFSWLLFAPLAADDSLEHLNHPVATPNIEVGVSSLVGGCVNAITGDYVESTQDLVVAGPEPLIFERFYATSDYRTRCLGSGWRHNHAGYILPNIIPHFDRYECEYCYVDPNGYSARFRECETPVHLPKDLNKKGFTNCSTGIIGGRSNLKNTHFSPDYTKKLALKEIIIRTPAGHKQYFYTWRSQLLLKSETKRNRHRVFYERDNLHRINRINLTPLGNKTPYSWIAISDVGNKEIIDKKKIIISASDGRSVTYKLWKSPSKTMQYYIGDVLKSHAPQETYRYAKKEADSGYIVRRKKWPNDHFRNISYYTKKTDHLSSSDFKLDRVKEILAPLGHDATPIRAYSFTYKATLDSDKEVEEGSTTVLDALNYKTIYHYSKEHRLTAIERFDSENKLYSKECFEWGNQDHDFGNLLSTRLEDASGKVMKGQLLHYDLSGNVVEEKIFGNITGNAQPGTWQSGGPSSADSYSKYFAYNSENLLIEHAEDNGRLIRYSYYPKTELVASKFIEHGSKIHQRNFYKYDTNGVLIETIIDDGSSPTREDLSFVSERKITRITPRTSMPIGLPEHIHEYYLDISTGQEILLKHIINTHSVEGYLLKQDCYDAKDSYCYSRSWEYNAHGKVYHEINPMGHLTERTYNENDELIIERFPNQVMKGYVHDFSGRVITIKNTDDNQTLATQNSYDLKSQLIAAIDPFGNKTEFLYDAFGRVVKEILPPSPNEHGELVSAEIIKQYDLLGNVLLSKGPSGEVTTTRYNLYGKPTWIEHSDATKETFEYYPNGNLKKSVAKNGLITLYTYDFLDRIVKKELYAKNKLHSVTTNTYNAFHLISSSDALGIITAYQYDYAGRLIAKETGDSLTQYIYDDLGREKEIHEWYSDNAYRCTCKTFDYLNNLLEESVKDSQSDETLRCKTYTYDTDGNVLTEKVLCDTGTAITQTVYNGRKQPIYNIDAEGHTTHFEYNYKAQNAQGQNVLETIVTDPLGNQTITTLDSKQQIASLLKKNPFGDISSKQEFIYNASGNRILQLDTVIAANSPNRLIKTRYRYNAFQLLVELIEAEGTPEERHTRYFYNSAAQKIKTIKPDGILLLNQYEPLGKLSHFNSSDQSFFYSYEYDLNDHLTCVLDKRAQSYNYRYYDQNNRLIEEIFNNNQKVQYQYDRLGRPIKTTFSDQSSVLYEYNACYLTRVTRLNPSSQELYTHRYLKHDHSGNLLEMQLPGTAGQITLAHNLKGELTQIKAPVYSETLQYDPVGNLIEKKENHSAKEILTQYTYDDLYQVKTETGHNYRCDSLFNCLQKDDQLRTFNSLNQLLTHGDQQYTYDNDGRMLSRKTPICTTEYTYDALDRLIQVKENDQKTTYTYDSFNRRLTKQTPTQLTHYIYQGQNEVGAYQDGKLIEFRLLGTGKGAEIGASIAFELHGTPYVPIHDHNGNVTTLLNLDGTLHEKYQYTAFGEETITDSSNNTLTQSLNPWRFSSKRHDSETGFIYFGRRYYDPKTLRWTTPDPLGYTAGPNLYAYAMNNPLTRFDLYGLDWMNQRRPFCESSGKGPQAGPGLLSQILSFPGQLLYNIGRHLTPLPIIGDIIKSAGHLLCGSNPHCQSVLHEQHSQPETVGNSPEHPNVSVVSANGMLTSFLESKDRACEMASYLGTKVHAVWNATHGGMVDIFECIAQHIGFNTHSVYILAEELRNELKRIGPEGNLFLHAHSQAGLTTYRACELLSEDERKRINVYTYGSAKMVFADDLGLAGATNFVSTRDSVPFLSDPVGCFKGWMRNDNSVEFVKSQGTPFIDHGFKNGIYDERCTSINKMIKHNYLR